MPFPIVYLTLFRCNLCGQSSLQSVTFWKSSFSVIFPAYTFWRYGSRHLAGLLPLNLQKAFKKIPHVKYSPDSAQWLNKLLQNLNCKINMRAMLLTSFVEVLGNLSQVSLILAEIWMIFNGFAYFSRTGWTRRSGINFMSWSYVWDLPYLQVCIFYTPAQL